MAALDPAFDSIYPDPTSASYGLLAGYNSSNCGNHKPTNVISVSYLDYEAAYTPAYLKRQCLEYLKLGLQGVTMVFAAGGFGVAGQAGVCLDPVTGQITTSTTGNFNPEFPSACLYVTSVGTTQLPVNAGVLDPEIALYHKSTDSTFAEILTSGGGFSNVFGTPRYQAAQVQKYLSQQGPKLNNISSLYNSSGHSRGFPTSLRTRQTT